MKKPKQHTSYVQQNNTFLPHDNVSTVSKLIPGVYEVATTPNGQMFFAMMETAHDGIVDLPSTEYTRIVEQIDEFLKPETRALFNDLNYLYKLNALVYGIPGGGKTCIVNRVIAKLVSAGGVVLFNPHPQLVNRALTAIKDIEPDTTVMVIFEELDKLMQRYEGDLLDILDGEIQKDNTIILATTNFINLLPPRILRSGRFSTKVEVKMPTASTREYYIRTKIKDEAEVRALVAASHNFTIDDVRNLIRDVKCLKQTIESAAKHIAESNKLVGKDTRSDVAAYRDPDDLLADIMVKE